MERCCKCGGILKEDLKLLLRVGLQYENIITKQLVTLLDIGVYEIWVKVINNNKGIDARFSFRKSTFRKEYKLI